MAIRSTAGRSALVIQNRPDANPPLVFADYTPTSNFTMSIMAKVLDATVPDSLIVYEGTNGTRLLISMQKDIWIFEIRNSDAVSVQTGIIAVTLGSWTAFSIWKNGTNLKVSAGTEPNPPNAANIIALPTVIDINPNISFTFDHIAFVASHNIAICNFKYWDYALSSGHDAAINSWDLVGGPKWASPLRTPGDISNIANPYTSPSWGLGHGYTTITPNADNFEMVLPDPAFMAAHTPCPTWVYAVNPNDFITANPVNTPLVQTTYKSTNFWTFRDRGSVPLTAFTGITYYAYPFPIGVGVPQSDSWPLFIDNTGTELVTNLTDPANRFEQDTGVAIPNTITPLTMYAWKFGGQFTWPAHTPPPVPTSTAALGFGYLYVVYTGFPSGVPSLPVQDLTGLFVIDRGGKSVDRYNNGVERKIPDPTIKTAYIGE